MDKELEQYYSTYFDLFRSAGWKQLITELTNNAMALNSVENLKDVNDMFYKKGQLNVLASLLNFETTINTAYEDQVNDVESI